MPVISPVLSSDTFRFALPVLFGSLIFFLPFPAKSGRNIFANQGFRQSKNELIKRLLPINHSIFYRWFEDKYIPLAEAHQRLLTADDIFRDRL